MSERPPLDQRPGTTLHLWGVCRDCSDQFSVVVRVRRDSRNPEVLRGWLEPSREAHFDSGLVRHRCGGVVRVYGHDQRILLEG